jgi:hypothetical protein
MKSLSVGRYAFYALSICSVAAFLAGCRANPGIGIPTTAGSTTRAHSDANGKTFFYTGKPQVFEVPANVHSITVVVRGASGEYCHGDHSFSGKGGRVFAVIPVTPHQKLWVYVGGQGNGSSGGFNGGGNGGDPPSFGNPSSGGGGASDVRVAPGRRSDRILVAGGGGGDGEPFGNTTHAYWGCAGYGGGLVGGDGLGGFNYYGNGGGGGGGGSQGAGGTGGQGGAPNGNAGENGRLGIGGTGGQAGAYSHGGGGGGGGYYGGGGGGGGESESSNRFGGGGGGGGGSAFAEPKATHVRFWSNWKNATGDGLVVFDWQ